MRIEQGKLEESAEAGEAPRIAGDGDEVTLRRDRLLAALTLIAGGGLMLAMPFALRAGRRFFLPLTAALVIAIALVPLLEWLERRRVPAPLAALLCVSLFLVLANIALASIVVPAIEWFRVLPERIVRIQTNLAPLLDLYASLERFVNETLATVRRRIDVRGADGGGGAAAIARRCAGDLGAVRADPDVLRDAGDLFLPRRLDPAAARAITSRASFGGAMATARVIQEVVDATSAYLCTIT